MRGRLQPVEIALADDGTILSLGRTRSGAPRTDFGEGVILPAATDLHVHFRDPGPSEAGESFGTGTIAAALGGVGLVGEMPNTDPPVTSVDRVEEKEARVRGKAAVDVLIYALPTRAREVARLAPHAGAFKIYLSPTSFVPDVPDDEEVGAVLRAAAQEDLAVSVHAEDPRTFRSGSVAHDPAGWARERPSAAEAAALERLAGRPEGLRLHVAHVTMPTSLPRLTELGASFEATPHHLLLSDRSGHDAKFKVNPPLRTEEERAALWEAFRAGRIPCVASDHAPHPLSAKELPFDRAPSGVPGVETMLPLLLARVRAGELPLATLIATACDRPARWLGQPVGRIAPGHRANLLVVDFKRRAPLRAGRLFTACGWSPFEGWEAILPLEHWRDGERIVDGGEYVGSPTGRVVRPEFAPGPSGRVPAGLRPLPAS